MLARRETPIMRYCIWVATRNLRGTIICNYLLFKNRIFLQHVSNFYSSSGNEREQKIILVEEVDTKTVIWQNGLSENLPN